MRRVLGRALATLNRCWGPHAYEPVGTTGYVCRRCGTSQS